MSASLVVFAVGASLLAPVALAQEAPPLPQGPSDAPALPAGPEGPPLPAGPYGAPPPPPGPGESPTTAPAESHASAAEEEAPQADGVFEPVGGWAPLNGFWEVRGGVRTQEPVDESQASIGETRLQFDWEQPMDEFTVKVVGDVLYDAVTDRHGVNLETGEGFFDLRQAWLAFSPTDWMDVRAGRQILTWGTGDLVFLNDLFPKDFQSFFIGRDDEYLKGPSDAVKVSMFWEDLANVDLVYTPRMDADRYITGRRLSYYNPMAGGIVGDNAIVNADRRNQWFTDAEYALRVYRTVGAYELAGYGYWGYWKNPVGFNPATGAATFPRLSVYGASARGQVGKGIGNIESAYYNSGSDRDGTNPLSPNSQVRLLLGYEQDLPDLARDLTVGMQYSLEWMTQYERYRRTLPPGMPAADERRHLLTWRITKLLMNQNMTLSLFTFYSPSDGDAHLRPKVNYKIDDHWTVEAGANVFFGPRDTTFFGQLEDNSNVYASLRYSF